MNIQQGILKYLKIFIVLSLICTSCERQKAGPDQQKQQPMSWMQKLDASKPTIFTDEWYKAESAWAKLNKETYTGDELDAWIELQVEVLERTKSDKLKGGLHANAIQQMYFFPETSGKYLDWLKEGLRTNLFEGFIATKARELVSDIERNSAEKNRESNSRK